MEPLLEEEATSRDSSCNFDYVPKKLPQQSQYKPSKFIAAVSVDAKPCIMQRFASLRIHSYIIPTTKSDWSLKCKEVSEYLSTRTSDAPSRKTRISLSMYQYF